MSTANLLLRTRRFLPLFIVQFLGALNDNLFKNAALVFILFSLADQAGVDGGLLMPLGAGLFILPFFLFSATAGQMADRFDKASMVRHVKLAEVGVAIAGAAAILAESILGMMGVLFLLGAQSAFFGPLKYSLLPEALRRDELIGGNALIEAGTFLAILGGTIAGGLLIMTEAGPAAVAVALVALAVAGYAASLAVQSTGVSAPDAKIDLNVVRATAGIVAHVRGDRPLFLAVLAISWFWAVGAVFLAEFPALTKDVLGGDESVVTLLMTVFSVGIGVGSILCHRILDGEVTVRPVPLAAIGTAVFAFDLWLASSGMPAPQGAAAGAAAFLSTFAGWRIVVDLALISLCGGLFVVPLYAFVQDRAEEHRRAQVIAANNVFNALFMVAASLIVTGMLAVGLGVPDVFLAVAVASLAVAAIICTILPRELFRSLTRMILRRLYKVEVRGLEKLRSIDGPAVVVANHASWLDGPLLNAFLPGQSTFAIDTDVFNTWWGGLTRLFADMLPVDPANPHAVKTMIRATQSGRRLVIFPEGRITITGGLMKIHEGPAVIADRADAVVVPVRIGGAEFSTLSRMKGKLPLRLFPRVTIEILDPVRMDLPAEAKGKVRRQLAGDALYRVMSDMMFRTRPAETTLFEALIDARRAYGGGHGIVQDVDTMRAPLSYDRVVMGAMVLGRALSRITQAGERVGVMLPNSAGVVVTFFALQATGRVPAMLNFSTGPDAMISACRTATVRTVLTSRRFIEKARLEAAVASLSAAVRVVYLEDIRSSLGPIDKALGLLASKIPGRFTVPALPTDPAVVLFTSGSEGAPKGVVLSHRNLLSNIAQLGARISFNAADKVLNPLPAFHSFGLTGGTLLPVLSGIPTFMYPSPLHYRIVPQLCYAQNATVLFGTDTFLTGYAKAAHPYDLESIRYIFAGGEKLREETRRTYAEKFGKRVLEGYGATETAPVIAVNSPMHYRAGTIGRLLPGVEARLETVEGITEGSRLHVRGPNVMLGYMLADAPGELRPPKDGWYDTGDIVSIDEDGFVRIVGRAKRFAKVAGEMVSLTAVEAAAAELWPDAQHAAVALPDDRKGEQVVLVTEQADATRAALAAHGRSTGRGEIMTPRDVIVVDRLPLLGTGKIDYPAVSALVARPAVPA